MIDLNDFGFTAVDESELTAVQQATQTITQVSSTAEETQAKLDRLYNAIVPLLTNLKMNPEQEYILWPDRVNKVEQFEANLLSIYQGS